MARYPYILNRNGHYYFRVAVPVFHVNTLGRRELFYSLKTKDYAEAKVRSAALLSVAQEVFQLAQAGRADIANEYLKHSLEQLNFQRNHFERYSSLLAKLSFPMQSAEILSSNKGKKNEGAEMLSVVYQAYLDECKENRPKTLHNKQVTLNLWLDALNDMPVSQISKAHAREFKQLMMKLPANFNKLYKGKYLKEIDFSVIPENKKLSIKSVNIQLGYMRSFMNWAIQNGHYEGANPFIGLALKETVRAEEKRHSFSKEQLSAIFNTPLYKGCLSEKLHGRFIEGNIIIKDGLYWLPLIGLYSGARMQEICQLYVDDIRKSDDIWYFDFNAEGEDKHLKNASSKRKTPIHPSLIEMGLLEHCQQQKEKGKKRLFSDLPLSCDGTYSNAFSKRFNHFIKRFNIKTDRTSFHSFRHTFIDALREANVSREVRQALVGHLGAQSSHDSYGSKASIKVLYEKISLVKF